MGKASKQKATRKKAIEAAPVPCLPKSSQALTVARKAWWLAGVGVAVAGFWWTWGTKLEFTFDDAPAPEQSDVFGNGPDNPGRFKLTNQGKVPARALKFECRMLHVATGESGNTFKNVAEPDNHGRMDWLDGGRSTRISCATGIEMDAPISEGAVELIASYKLPLWPGRLTARTTFRTMRGGDGQVRWVEN